MALIQDKEVLFTYSMLNSTESCMNGDPIIGRVEFTYKDGMDLSVLKAKIGDTKIIRCHLHGSLKVLARNIPHDLDLLEIDMGVYSSYDMKEMLECKYLIRKVVIYDNNKRDHEIIRNRTRLHNCAVLSNIITDEISLFGQEFHTKDKIIYVNPPIINSHKLTYNIQRRMENALRTKIKSVKYGVRKCICGSHYDWTTIDKCPKCDKVDDHMSFACFNCGMLRLMKDKEVHKCAICRSASTYDTDNNRMTISGKKYYLCDRYHISSDHHKCFICNDIEDSKTCPVCHITYLCDPDSNILDCRNCKNRFKIYEDKSYDLLKYGTVSVKNKT
jgi:rubrerythrin